MPQPAKKDVIAKAALPLLLELGVKGTSIDKVVKASGVSKPTVYKHFPDKSALVVHAISLWLGEQTQPTIHCQSPEILLDELSETWLAPEPLRLYGLMMGESQRVPQALACFMEGFDQPWRDKLTAWSNQLGLDEQRLNFQVSHWIMQRLTQTHGQKVLEVSG
ncbi:TetR/AcrR family transcriptional regulator [Salinibius halmophilus]|uniref:TetR/AcrR family transcriptional regulator n=1 Tax=Salinibius halmophilus TaxID=1853216 RepID=UPI000E66FE5C|nr:TetR/AcrR family transcriptional regulator [Salinibius halmophilus]